MPTAYYAQAIREGRMHENPLLKAIEANSQTEIENLIRHYPDLLELKDEDGNNAINYALLKAKPSTLLALIKSINTHLVRHNIDTVSIPKDNIPGQDLVDIFLDQNKDGNHFYNLLFSHCANQRYLNQLSEDELCILIECSIFMNSSQLKAKILPDEDLISFLYEICKKDLGIGNLDQIDEEKYKYISRHLGTMLIKSINESDFSSQDLVRGLTRQEKFKKIAAILNIVNEFTFSPLLLEMFRSPNFIDLLSHTLINNELIVTDLEKESAVASILNIIEIITDQLPANSIEPLLPEFTRMIRHIDPEGKFLQAPKIKSSLKTIASLAIKDGSHEIFEFALHHYPSIASDRNTIIHKAARSQDPYFLTRLLEVATPNPLNISKLTSRDGTSPLGSAIKSLQLENIFILLEAGAIINHDRQPYDIKTSAIREVIEPIQDLVAKISQDTDEDLEGEIIEIIENLQRKTSRRILNFTIPYTFSDGTTEYTTLIGFLLANGKEDVLRNLYSMGYNMDHRDMQGNSALHVACKEGAQETIGILYDLDADPLLKDPQGLTAIHLAIDSGCDLDTIKLLIQDTNLAEIKSEKGLDLAQYALRSDGSDLGVVYYIVNSLYPKSITSSTGDQIIHFAIESEDQTRIEAALMKEATRKIGETLISDAILGEVTHEVWEEISKSNPDSKGKNTIFENLSPCFFIDNLEEFDELGQEVDMYEKIKEQLERNLNSYFENPSLYMRSRANPANNHDAKTIAHSIIEAKYPGLLPLPEEILKYHKVLLEQDLSTARNILHRPSPIQFAIEQDNPNICKSIILCNPWLMAENIMTVNIDPLSKLTASNHSIIEYTIKNDKLNAAIGIFQAMTFLELKDKDREMLIKFLQDKGCDLSLLTHEIDRSELIERAIERESQQSSVKKARIEVKEATAQAYAPENPPKHHLPAPKSKALSTRNLNLGPNKQLNF